MMGGSPKSDKLKGFLSTATIGWSHTTITILYTCDVWWSFSSYGPESGKGFDIENMDHS